jgi:hypothetical protein
VLFQMGEDHRADALGGDDFQQDGVRDAAVDDMRGGHAAPDGPPPPPKPQRTGGLMGKVKAAVRGAVIDPLFYRMWKVGILLEAEARKAG